MGDEVEKLGVEGRGGIERRREEEGGRRDRPLG